MPDLAFSPGYQINKVEAREFRKKVIRRKAIVTVGRSATDGKADRPEAGDAANANEAEGCGWPIGWILLIFLAVVVLSVLPTSAEESVSEKERLAMSHFIAATALLATGFLLVVSGAVAFFRLVDRPLPGETRWAWDGQGIYQQSFGATHVVWWDAMDRWYESGRLIAWRTKHGASGMVAKAALTGEQIDGLSGLLSRKLGPPVEEGWDGS